MRRFIQWILVIWFIALGTVVLSASVMTFWVPDGRKAPEPPPNPPSAPSDIDAAALDLYIQQVAAYEKSISAYTVNVQAITKSSRLVAYELIVKDTLVLLFGQLVAGFVTFAFVTVAARVWDNANRMSRGMSPERISVFLDR